MTIIQNDRWPSSSRDEVRLTEDDVRVLRRYISASRANTTHLQIAERARSADSAVSAVAIANPVRISYATAAGQSIPSNVDTIVTFGTAIIDAPGRVTPGVNWRFTANMAGVYIVSAAVMFTSSTGWSPTRRGFLRVRRSGTNYRTLDRRDGLPAGSAVYMRLSGGPVQIELAVGEYIDVTVNQNTTGALALEADASFNSIEIWKA